MSEVLAQTEEQSPTGSEALPRREITVHFDGSCLLTAGAPPGTLHPGGYAAVLLNDLTGSRKTLKGPLPDTTNNRAELTAAIKALEAIRPGAFVTMVGDSQLVTKGMTEWRFGWKRKSWRGSDNKPIKNLDLWLQLVELAEKPAKLEWVWTKGHAGHLQNEEVDGLARAEAEKLKAHLARQKIA
ncbi:ribonuclease H family protein [Bosea sp. LjRoot237]|uniref:ribonuclease H family protein n=1 Tax=Bosea sp. LjRoot237 TaxID=3342292 RepID=UPI003ED17001